MSVGEGLSGTLLQREPEPIVFLNQILTAAQAGSL